VQRLENILKDDNYLLIDYYEFETTSQDIEMSILRALLGYGGKSLEVFQSTHISVFFKDNVSQFSKMKKEILSRE
jgi:hypothetical protein